MAFKKLGEKDKRPTKREERLKTEELVGEEDLIS